MIKKRLYMSFLLSYLCFFCAAYAAVYFLTPRLLRSYLYAASDLEEYRQYLSSISIAIQNTCHILFVIMILFSLIPLFVFQLRIYRPLSRIIMAAAMYTFDDESEPISYSSNDELGNLSASLNYLHEAVCNSGEYQRQFISNVSHDFRSPLTSIKGYVEAMLDGTIPPEMQEKYLGIVLGETERLNKLTEGLLTLNTFDDHGVYLDFTIFDLVQVIRDSVASFEVISGQKNISIDTAFSSPVIQVRADLSKIQQVLYNLIDNAIKFSEHGSSIQIEANGQSRRVYVSVKDHGDGISRENLPKIWDRFYKTDSSRGRDKKGTGLGLSIVKEIIRAHDQNINVISTEGVGSEFVFTLEGAEP